MWHDKSIIFDLFGWQASDLIKEVLQYLAYTLSLVLAFLFGNCTLIKAFLLFSFFLFSFFLFYKHVALAYLPILYRQFPQTPPSLFSK